MGEAPAAVRGKDDLLVIDFVDNANMFNMPYSLHRVLDISKYQPMAYVLAPGEQAEAGSGHAVQGRKAGSVAGCAD